MINPEDIVLPEFESEIGEYRGDVCMEIRSRGYEWLADEVGGLSDGDMEIYYLRYNPAEAANILISESGV